MTTTDNSQLTTHQLPMIVILVCITFALCIMVDWLLHRREERQTLPQPAPLHAPRHRSSLSPPIYVGGFRIHEELAFHPGHSWAHPEGMNLVRVGLDDFAAKLVGKIDSIRLPETDGEVTQGQEAWVIHGRGREVPILSPISGKVLEVNPLALSAPETVGADPYGKGWLFLARTQDLRRNMNNLLTGDLVRRWVEEACVRLRHRVDGGFSLTFPDGGTATANFAASIDDALWADMVREFLLTDPCEGARVSEV